LISTYVKHNNVKYTLAEYITTVVFLGRFTMDVFIYSHGWPEGERPQTVEWRNWTWPQYTECPWDDLTRVIDSWEWMASEWWT